MDVETYRLQLLAVFHGVAHHQIERTGCQIVTCVDDPRIPSPEEDRRYLEVELRLRNRPSPRVVYCQNVLVIQRSEPATIRHLLIDAANWLEDVLGRARPSGMDDLTAELRRARAKFPAGRLLVEALCEELGEAARDPDHARPGCAEWLQVACVAMRIYTEGCPDAGLQMLAALQALESPARAALAELDAALP